MNMRAWLRRQPKPVLIKAELLNGDEKVYAVAQHRSWAGDAERALKDAVRAEALNEKDQTIRIWEADNIEELTAAKTPAEADPLSTSVERIASILSEACDRAVSRHSEIVRTGFEQMGQLVQVLSARNAALEKAWHQLFFSQTQAEQNDADPNNALVGTLMQLAIGGGMAPPKPPPVNGKPDGS
jgi:hypothetical protein